MEQTRKKKLLKRLCLLFVIILILAGLFIAFKIVYGRIFTQNVYNELKSIRYTFSFAGIGTIDDFNETRVTVFSDGRVLKEKIHYHGELLSSEEFLPLSEEEVFEVVRVLYKSGFFGLPDDVTDRNSHDGYFHYLEVETESYYYKKGGLNPNNNLSFMTGVHAVWMLVEPDFNDRQCPCSVCTERNRT